MSDALAPPRRSRRSDAVANRERVLEAAIRVFAVDGLRVPVAAIAEEAGVGIATFYRSFADRDDLLAELERRAYAALNATLDELESRGTTGLAAVEQFLVATIDMGDRMVLPLHGAPPLVDPESVAARGRIVERLERFLAQARADGTGRADVNASDVIACSALITQPLRHSPDWPTRAARHVALFVAGLAPGGPLPGPAVTPEDVETEFRSRARRP